MRLLNPSGLWLLLGIPVLIIIYLIRSQHEDRPVSSTYIWKLSSRFMKKRLPLQRLRRMLIFLMQLLMVACTALMASRPALVTGKSTQYIAIIDASASMRTENADGVSRFDRALEEVAELTACIDRGHRVSVILAGDKASFLLQNAQSANNVRLALDNAVCGYGSCHIDQALALIQPMSQKGAVRLYFYTDTDYPGSENIRIHNLHENEWNISVDALQIEMTEEGDEYLAGYLTSHNRDAEFTVGLKVDGRISGARSAVCPADTQTQVQFPMPDTTDYETLELFIEEQDGMLADNSRFLCVGHDRVYNVLLASQSPLYLQSAINALGSCVITAVSSLEDMKLSGYDLYVFDGVYPQDYPTDGSVLQFGTQKLPQGLDAADTVTGEAALTRAGITDSPMLADLTLYDTVLAQYVPMTGSGDWESLLLAGNAPVCMTRDSGTGQRFTVCGFDLHHSNLPMQTDFVVLMRNFVENSLFDLLSRTDFAVGETATLSILPAARELYVQLPDSSVQVLSTEGNTGAFTPETTGLHTAVITTDAGGDYVDFFVHIPDQETTCPPQDGITAPEGSFHANATDAMTQLWPYLAGLLLLLLLAEWGVYHYEQY